VPRSANIIRLLSCTSAVRCQRVHDAAKSHLWILCPVTYEKQRMGFGVNEKALRRCGASDFPRQGWSVRCRVRHVCSRSRRYLFNVQLDVSNLNHMNHAKPSLSSVANELAGWCDGKLREASIALTSASPHPHLEASLHLTLDILKQPRFLQPADESFPTHAHTTYLSISYINRSKWSRRPPSTTT
jgi:hypothetical protein